MSLKKKPKTTRTKLPSHTSKCFDADKGGCNKYASRLRHFSGQELCDNHCTYTRVKQLHWSYEDIMVVDADGSQTELPVALAEAGVRICLGCNRSGVPYGWEVHRTCDWMDQGTGKRPEGISHWA